jgi:hypothetical protein
LHNIGSARESDAAAANIIKAHITILFISAVPFSRLKNHQRELVVGEF